LLLLAVAVADSYRQAKGESPCGTFVLILTPITFLLRFGHLPSGD
jgi:hypothetical protein